MNKQEDIDKLFRDALHDHESSPSPQIWDKIAGQLDEEHKVVPMAATNRSRMAWAKYAAAACLLIGLTIGYFALINDHTTTDPLIVKQGDQGNRQEKRVLDVAPVHNNGETIQEDVKEIEPIIRETKVILVAEQSIEPAPRVREDSQEDVLLVEEDMFELEEPVMENIQYAAVDPEIDMQVVQVAEESKEPTFISVTEADPIRPIIDLYEEEDNMIAGAVRKTTHGVLGGLLNRINDNISNITGNEVNLATDDEGSLRIDFSNLIARNKNKKRR